MKLTGRALEIVTGRSELSVADVSKYRDRFSASGVDLPSMDEGAAPLSSVGTQLHSIIAKETGVEIPCNECAEEISSLDLMTILEATSKKEQVVDGIYRRAWDHASWKDKLKLAADAVLTTASGGKANVGKGIIGGWFDEAVKADQLKPAPLPGKHRPPKKKCSTCGGKKIAKRRASARIGPALPNQKLHEVPVETKAESWDPTRHLIFHIYPRSDQRELWEWHLDWLKKYRDFFNGRRIIGIVIDDQTVAAEDVKDYMGEGFEFLVKDNVRKEKRSCCENVTFYDMVDDVDGGVCFYAHAKGVASVKVTNKIARRWSSEMYSYLLGEYSPRMLMDNGAHGTFLTDFTTGPVISGTFFWFRVDEAKSRPWKNIRTTYPAVELWPTDVFQHNHHLFARDDLRSAEGISYLQSPSAWGEVDRVKMYRSKFQLALKDAKASVYPSDRFSGRGIVMPAGGWWKLRKPHQPYLWCAYIATTAIRRKGCDLPVQWWFLPGEIEEVGEAVIQKWAARVGASTHVVPKDAAKGGWQIKIYAILNSPFREVIHLDSDVICTVNLHEIFNEPGYKDTGVHFWADNPKLTGPMEKCSFIQPSTWSLLGVPNRGKVRDIEAGQMVINKERAWAALQVDQHFADNAEYWEGFNGGDPGIWYGDKTSHHVACIVTDTPYYRDDRFEFNEPGGFYAHRNAGGEVAFQHCCHRKGHLVNGTGVKGLSESEAIASIGRRRSQGQEPHGSHIGDYCFLHMYKTGGTSLRQALVNQGMPAYRCEHFTWQGKEDGLKVITVLRDPAARIISHYNDMKFRWRYRLDNGVWGRWNHDISLEEFESMTPIEFAAYDSYGVSANLQAQRFGPTLEEAAHGVSANLQTQMLGPTLDEAVANLRKCEYVWHTETLDDDVRELSQRLNVSFDIKHVNKRPDSGLKVSDLSAEEIEQIKVLAADDMKLWQMSHHL